MASAPANPGSSGTTRGLKLPGSLGVLGQGSRQGSQAADACTDGNHVIDSEPRACRFDLYTKLAIRGTIFSANRRRHYVNAAHAPLETAPEPIARPTLTSGVRKCSRRFEDDKAQTRVPLVLFS